MATISITIPDAVATRVVEALCDGDSPTQAKAKAEVLAMIKSRVIAYESQKTEATETAKLEAAKLAYETAIRAAINTTTAEVTLN